MDGLILYFEILAAFFLLVTIVLVFAFAFGNYHPNEAQKKVAWEEYERKKEKKKAERMLKRSDRVRTERIIGTKCYRTVKRIPSL